MGADADRKRDRFDSAGKVLAHGTSTVMILDARMS
jgi:hypothetical protein